MALTASQGRRLIIQGLVVRRLHWLIIAVFFFPWSVTDEAIGIPSASAQAVPVEDMSGPWRRTREGWQRIELLSPPVQYHRPALHPAVVGALEVLLTMTAMLALSANNVVPQRARSAEQRSPTGFAVACTSSSQPRSGDMQ